MVLVVGYRLARHVALRSAVGRSVRGFCSEPPVPESEHPEVHDGPPEEGEVKGIPPVEEYNALEITPNGEILNTTLSISKLVAARDLRQLGLGQWRHRQLLRVPPCILPRGPMVLGLIGHFKFALFKDRVLFFDPDRPAVNAEASYLSMQLKNRVSKRRPFELYVMEHVLWRVSDRYTRQAAIAMALVDSVLKGMQSTSSEATIERSIHQINPLKNGLSEFERKTDELLSLLDQILDDRKRSSSLMLSQQEKGYCSLQDRDLHHSIEMMLETYRRALEQTKREVGLLRLQVQTGQELIQIRASLMRNRIIRMNLHLTVLTVCCAIACTICGFFGMNVPMPEGIVNYPYMFHIVTVSSLLSSAAAGAFAMRYIQGWKESSRKSVEDDVTALQKSFEHVSAIEYLFYSLELTIREEEAKMKELGEEEETAQPSFTKERFSKLLSREVGSEVGEQVVDLIFTIFDKDKDGTLRGEEVQVRRDTRAS